MEPLGIGANHAQENREVAAPMAPTHGCVAPSRIRKTNVQTKAYDARQRGWCRSFILPYAASLSPPATNHDHLRSTVLMGTSLATAEPCRLAKEGARSAGDTDSGDAFLASFFIRLSRRKRYKKLAIRDRIFVTCGLVFREREREKEPLPRGELTWIPHAGRR